MRKISNLWTALRAKLKQRWALTLIIAGSFAAITSCIASITAIISFFWPPESPPAAEKSSPAFYGRWLSEYEYPNPPAMVSIRAVTEYLENGTYRVAGHMTIKDPKIKVVRRIDGAGTWEGNDEWIITTLNDRTDSILFGQTGTNVLSAAQTIQLGVPQRVTDGMPRGMSERYEVRAIKPDRIELRLSDLAGTPVDFTMVRTQSRTP